MERKTRYTMVDKRGKELYSSDSFLGFIGSTIIVQLGSAIVIAIIGAVICGIASLFSKLLTLLTFTNMEAESLFFFIIALALAYGVGCLGRTRKIGFWPAFLLSILNVIIGLIAVLCSKKIDKNESNKQLED